MSTTLQMDSEVLMLQSANRSVICWLFESDQRGRKGFWRHTERGVEALAPLDALMMVCMALAL